MRTDKPLTSDPGLHADPTFDNPFDHPDERRRKLHDPLAPLSLSDSASARRGQRLCDLNRGLERHYPPHTLVHMFPLPPIIFCFSKKKFFNARCEEEWRHCHWRWCYLGVSERSAFYYRPLSSNAYMH